MAATGEWSYDRYREGTAPLPSPNLAWNTYGEGVESIGRDGRPEPVDIPAPAPDQLLVRVDAVGLCFSDVKLIRLGSEHPKLYGRDLSADPIRLGHEATVTVIEVGDDLADTYRTGDRLAIQPDIYLNGRSVAYGYTIPGGLIQYHLIGPEILAADGVSYVIPVAEGIGYAAAALSEPWACVEAAYTQRRRLWPRTGGTAWIIGHPDDERSYDFGETLHDTARVVLTGVSPRTITAVLEATGPRTETSVVDAPEPAEYSSLVDRETDGEGFDDIVLLDPRSASQVTEVARHIAFRGTLNLVGERPLDGLSSIDFGRLHYDYTAFVGTRGPKIAAAYGEQRNRCDLRPGGLAVFVGAGGPMGQMHVQRALEKADGPAVVIGIDPDRARLDVLADSLGPLAERAGRELIVLNADASDPSVRELVDQRSASAGADDVVVTVPVASVMASAAQLMSPDGMLVFFAGVANGTTGLLDMSRVYLSSAQYTGTSGSTLDDQALVLDKAAQGSLSPDLNLAAVGGIEAGRDGVQAMLDGRFAGKIVIFPQVAGMPLLGLDELADKYPDIGSALGPQGQWTSEAERRLLEMFGLAEDS
ncbi:MAG: alcohol dehydrogenase catalytic domain-containing protein [Acidimicrobiaceae bacterium]|nr:alcohol dehydrogenase catalytic domain-containing protein [Acidimicrobiaceae bacterium]MDE0318911.1 alcohol dehydrogenase catalytic domain-containing protein [Acidimicrobiaceae bacterium]